MFKSKYESFGLKVYNITFRNIGLCKIVTLDYYILKLKYIDILL